MKECRPRQSVEVYPAKNQEIMIPIAVEVGPVHYWKINLANDGEARWIRAVGQRVIIGSFGEFYAGKRFDEDHYAVTHPATGYAVSYGYLSLDGALGAAAAILWRNFSRFEATIAGVPHYAFPDLDPAQCDEVWVPARRVQ